ncbi:MAG: enoyl-CoA hydratase, partial [Desulfosarcina sp.]|nr:enoyl-CoA hydratase [Desulfosarcina sp.]
LPGPGTVYMRQTLDFLAPVRIGDTVTATVEVVEKMEDKKRVRLRTTCVTQQGTLVLDGEALVSPPRPPK